MDLSFQQSALSPHQGKRRTRTADALVGRQLTADSSALLVIDLDILIAMPRAAGAQPTVDKAVEIAVEDTLRVAGADAGPQVLHHLVRLQHVTADLAAEADFSLLAVEFFHLAALRVESLF